VNDQQDDIEQILSELNAKKEIRQQDSIEQLEPPRLRENYIDFAKPEEPTQKPKKPKQKKEPKPKKSAEELEEIKAKKAQQKAKTKAKATTALTKIKKAVFNKKVLVAIVTILVIIAVAFSAKYAIAQSKSAYLKQYEKKYPDTQYTVGMLEKYCDLLGENPNAVGYLEISDINLQTTVSSNESEYPYAQSCTDTAQQFNYVVYLDDNSLEGIYSTAQGYNSASQYITYSDFFSDYNFKVMGVFYTNTNEEDDNGYIFPYNVTEKMTVKSANNFVSKLKSRFIYDIGADINRQDTLITISCPTDYRDGYRFVVVGALRQDTSEKSTATEKSSVHYQQVIYDELGIDNPYKYASKWYPEIILTDSNGNETTLQKTIEDYK
jgi:hypothetical protein